ncbi:MAG TPA: hypothetical protein VN962_06420 [Polyangia bacterium]|nr:hypothetical protein [Polyangia bacterium]
MIVFGDRTRVRSPAAQIAALQEALARLPGARPGIQRHAALVALLLAAGELAQGLADAAFARTGRDGQDDAASMAMTAAVALGRAVWRSHRAAYAGEAAVDGVAGDALNRLAALALPDEITIHPGEGFQHYAVYPETYACAAASAFQGRPPGLVVGIRSIGSTLAAAVAGVLPASAPLPITVRPVGPPFERRLALADDLAQALAGARGRPVAVVDEGPGLSGSSFGAVLDALESAGIPDADARVFPSHAGDVGPAASPRTRTRWATVARVHVPFETAFLDPQQPGLREWVADLIGRLDEPPQDLGAGGWRRQVWSDAAAWPPAMAMRERRKYLLRAGGQRFLARFIGLGETGAAASARAESLAAAGFSPPVAGIRHGFLLTRWIEADRLWPVPLTRARLIDRLAAYLSFRAHQFPGDRGRGASPAALLEMARLNAAEAGATAAAARLERFASWLPALSRAARPIAIDGRLHGWEWLLLPDGRLWKTDAVDHCDAHDPIGHQDLAWDVAGASVELQLDRRELARLCDALASSGHPIEREPLTFYRETYLGFQLGLHASAVPLASDASEVARLSAAADGYRRWLDVGAGQP